MTTVAERLSNATTGDHPSPTAVADLAAWLERELARITGPWAGEHGSLGITKNRILATARCPASVLAESVDLDLSTPLVLGALVDTAAAALLVSEQLPGSAPWLGALSAIVEQTQPELAAYIERLSVEDRQSLRDLTQERCDRLVTLLGDLRATPGTAQEMFRVEWTEARVSLTGRTDLVLGRGARTIVEVKSGAVRPAHVDEAGFYALLAALRDGVAPRSSLVVTLDPGVVTEYEVTADSLEAAARRVIDAAEALVAIDQTVRTGGWPATIPGNFCAWCGVLDRCPDAPDVARAEAEALADPAELDELEDEPW